MRKKLWQVTLDGNYIGQISAASKGAALRMARYEWGSSSSLSDADLKRFKVNPKKRANPRQPHRRVRKALKKYVGKQLGLPTQYTPAKVRVDSKGEIDIKFSRPPKGATRNPKRFSVTANGRKKARVHWVVRKGDDTRFFSTERQASKYASKYGGTVGKIEK